MLTIDLCEVRYAIIPAAYADGEIMRRLSYALNELSDLLPPYLIHADGNYAYVYFAYEPSKRSLELVNGWMGTYAYINWNIKRDDLA